MISLSNFCSRVMERFQSEKNHMHNHYPDFQLKEREREKAAVAAAAEIVTKENSYKMQKQRYEIYKAQDLENGRFDVTFEVEGKKLHAHKFILTSISEPLDAMLSDRWSKKEEIVKIESYSYENFYQFLCFVYSGYCELTSTNIREMIDMSEFYGVPLLKKLCDKFLSAENIFTVENVEELYEFSQTYALPSFVSSVKEFVSYNGAALLESPNFINYKKVFVQLLCNVHQRRWKETVFEAAYKWAENEVMKKKAVDDDGFDRVVAIKAEMNTILPNIEFQQMSFEFLMNFVVENGFTLSSEELFQFYQNFGKNNNYIKNEKFYQSRFKQVYELAEKQIMKQNNIINENLNLFEAVKTDLDAILQEVEYFNMKFGFLHNFVLEKGFTLSSAELSKFYQSFKDGELIIGFKQVYKLAEKQALQKQKLASNENFDLAASIKGDLADTIPYMKLYTIMCQEFLTGFIVANGILTEEQINNAATRVEIKNGDKLFTGIFTDDGHRIRRAIEKVDNEVRNHIRRGTNKIRFFNVKIRIPKTPSTLMKMKGVEWYLCLEKDEILTLKHHTRVEKNDYLLVEMSSPDNLELDTGKYKTYLSFYNNV